MGVVSSSLGLQMGSWVWSGVGWRKGVGGSRVLASSPPPREASGRAQGCPTPRQDSGEVPASEVGVRVGAEERPPGGSSSLLSP